MLKKREWDSNFFSKNIWELNEISDKVQYESGLIISKVNASSYEDINKLNSFNFRYCEGELDFEYQLSDSDLLRDSLTIATKGQLTRILDSAKHLYSFSRFREPWFTLAERETFYSQWIINSLLHGFEDLFLIDIKDNEIRGFVTLKFDADIARVGLIGVAEKHQGKGVGRVLLDAVKHESVKRGFIKLRVATQLSNKNAVKLYEKNGFELINSFLWFYKLEK
ncbi:MAG: dTDP-4-amino-4,6-dideoxy-D-galactose acyltransferase [Alteromonadaceae bacterium]|jgi:dTDP-4-amino-4,6-dideoxy-D-galactose acyltransferase